MEQNGQTYRHELKYVVSAAQLALLQTRAKLLLSPDAHVLGSGQYRIRSVYFDDLDDRCFYENENGTDPREKFRIRIYNGSAERITLECKRKERDKTLKTACPLTRAEAEQLLLGRPLTERLSERPSVLQKLCLEMLCRGMQPKVIVEYDRIPWVYRNGNVRITFDTNVSSSPDVGSFFAPTLVRRPVMPAGQEILEVKYDEYLPAFIHQGLQMDSLNRTAFSKYYLCRKFSIIRSGTP